MKNQRQIKINMQVEVEPAIGEAEVKTEATRAEDMEALTITSTSEEAIDGVDIETTARRCNLGS